MHRGSLASGTAKSLNPSTPWSSASCLGILEELELPKHHTIFLPGGACDSIYFIEKGRVRVTRLSTEGKTVILWPFSAPET